MKSARTRITRLLPLVVLVGLGLYGATVDNRTGDPSFQIARFLSTWDY